MKRLGFMLVLAIILTLPCAAVNAIAGDNYFAIKAGIFTPTGDLEDFDNAFQGEIAIGHNFNPNFGLEFGIGRFETDATYGYGGYDSEIGNWSGSETDEVTVTPVTITARGIIPIDKLSLYAGAGVGLYFATGEVAVTGTSDIGNVSFSGDDDDMVPGVHVLAGIEYNLTPEVFAGIEARNTWTETAKFEGLIYGVPIEAESDLNGWNIAAKIGYRF